MACLLHPSRPSTSSGCRPGCLCLLWRILFRLGVCLCATCAHIPHVSHLRTVVPETGLGRNVWEVGRKRRYIKFRVYLAGSLVNAPCLEARHCTDVVLLPSGSLRQKIYLATDIAEVSITLADVVFVVDLCLVKRPIINHDEQVRGRVMARRSDS